MCMYYFGMVLSHGYINHQMYQLVQWNTSFLHVSYNHDSNHTVLVEGSSKI